MMINQTENRKSTVLGIDIGGTGIKFALVDTNDGTLVTSPQKIATPQPATVKSVLGIIENTIRELQWKGPVGCGFPGIVKHGTIRLTVNMAKDWIGYNLLNGLMKITTAPVNVANDADSAAIAEMKFGAGRERSCRGGGLVLLVTLGTGIGSALFIDGILVPNTEFGQIEMNGIKAEKRAATVIRERENLSWEEWGGRLNHYLKTMEMLLSPDCIIIGGGVSENPEKFLPYLQLDTEVIPARMQNNAGIIGAALTVMI